jgi:outer membrane biosynthesis protein TonB
MGQAVHRHWWGLSGLSSVGAHGVLVAACLIGPIGGKVRRGSYHGPGPMEPVEVALVSPAELEPEQQPAPASPRPAPLLAPPAVARGGRTRHPRPMRAPPTVRLPSQGNPLVPPPFPAEEGDMDDVPSLPDGPSLVTAGSGGPGRSGTFPSPESVPDRYPISPVQARYLRVYEKFPTLPSSLWARGTVYSVELRICVATDGAVSDVTLLKSTVRSLDDAVMSDARTWRYRPLLVAGAARPFCHLILIHYMAE